MKIAECRDQKKLESFLRQNTAWHLYALADLDAPFWETTRWFVAEDRGEVQGAVVLVGILDSPILYAICAPNDPITRSIVTSIDAELPAQFFAHVGLGVFEGFHGIEFQSEGVGIKMLRNKVVEHTPHYVSERETSFKHLKDFYDNHAYGQDNESRFFEPYMLQMSPYRVIKENGKIVSAAGVHVASRRYSVASLGNVATTPDLRGKGMASAAVFALVGDLQPQFSDIGLNVLKANTAAVRCYERLGFEASLEYEEGMVFRK